MDARRRRVLCVVSVTAAVPLLLAAGVAASVRVSAAGRVAGARRARSGSVAYVLTKVGCTAAPYVAAGDGCYDSSAFTASEWQIGAGTATWTHTGDGGWKGEFSWTLPSSIEDGKPFSVGLSLTATDIANGSGFCPALAADVNAEPSRTIEACADPGKSASKSQTFKLTGFAAGSDEIDVTIRIQDGPSIDYEYELEATPAPAPTSTATTTEPSTPSSGSCGIPSWLKHGTRMTQAASAVRRTLAPNEVAALHVCPDVQFHRGGTPADAWLPLEPDQILRAGDEITCDPDGVVTLAFADNSTVIVRNATQLKIASFFTEGGVVRTEILLKMGEVAAQVNKSEATKSDFRIKPPSPGAIRGGPMLRSGPVAAEASAAVTGDPGAELSVFYDPGSHTEIVDDYSGTVDVTRPGGSQIALASGKEVAVTGSSISPIAPIGKADARGGDNPETALNLVEAKIGAERTACSLRTPDTPVFSVRPAADGWFVSVLASAGKAKGTSTWNVAGSAVTPENADAHAVAGGCSSSGSVAPPSKTTPSTTTATGSSKESAQQALDAVLALLKANASACGFTSWRGTASGMPGNVTVTATILGSLAGTATWSTASGSLKPTNDLAVKAVAGCK